MSGGGAERVGKLAAAVRDNPVFKQDLDLITAVSFRNREMSGRRLERGVLRDNIKSVSIFQRQIFQCGTAGDFQLSGDVFPLGDESQSGNLLIQFLAIKQLVLL